MFRIPRDMLGTTLFCVFFISIPSFENSIILIICTYRTALYQVITFQNQQQSERELVTLNGQEQ